MRKKSLLFLLAAVLLFGVGCDSKQEKEESEYVLYFLVSDGSGHGSALSTEPYTGTEKSTEDLPEDQNLPAPGDLVQALVEGPKTEGLASPFPKDVVFQWWDWDPEQPGNVQIGLSEQYSELTDISLTLADYSIVLTLSQLEEVESVEIISGGRTANYRSHQFLRPEEALLIDEAAEQAA